MKDVISYILLAILVIIGIYVFMIYLANLFTGSEVWTMPLIYR